MTPPTTKPLTQQQKNERVAVEIMELSLGAQTDKDIQLALSQLNGFFHRIRPVEGWLFIDYWRNRFGADYQQDLEQHVADWSKAPPDYCNDLNLCRLMEIQMQHMDLIDEYIEAIEKPVRTDGVRVSSHYFLFLSAEARVDAALAALDSMKPAYTPEQFKAPANQANAETPAHRDGEPV